MTIKLFFRNLFQSVQWKYFLIVLSITIFISSLYFTLNVAEELKKGERKNMELIAESIVSVTTMSMDCDVTFQSKVIENNKNVPMILTDADDLIEDAVNYNFDLKTNKLFFKKELEQLKKICKPIVLDFKQLGIKKLIYYRQSKLISRLELFPYIQITILLLFILLIVVSLISIKKSQQEQIWVGMAKETAHQLGTPITSLIGWLENIKLSYPDNDKLLAIAEEMNKDVIMLDMVAGRFSKIGAKPELSEQNIFENLNRLYEYIKLRAPRKVQLYFPDFSERNILVAKINPLLFDWVIENLLKNALDALEGKGLIKVEVTDSSNWVHIDISDSGKGIPKSLFHKIFKPGFSTKKRGWGLGLSLSGRIIKDYHKGKIFVKNSIVNQGTTFRISLPKK